MKKDYIFVSIQFVLILIYFFVFQNRTGDMPLWMQICSSIMIFFGVLLVIVPILQLNKFISVFPTPVNDAKLITTGAFKYIRHPIYAGIVLGGTGLALFYHNFFQLLIMLFLYLLFEVKSNYEEQQLSKRFSEYEAYKKQTYKFFPGLR